MLFIYRNLHHGKAFSIRKAGKVVDRLECFEAHDVEFKVNQKGRERVLVERQKNVHAFIVTSSIRPLKQKPSTTGLHRVRYNPYEAGSFKIRGKQVATAKHVLFCDGHCYVKKC